jgi:hypothetical protein
LLLCTRKIRGFIRDLAENRAQWLYASKAPTNLSKNVRREFFEWRERDFVALEVDASRHALEQVPSKLPQMLNSSLHRSSISAKSWLLIVSLVISVVSFVLLLASQ